MEVDIDHIFSFSESLQRIFDEVDAVEFVRGDLESPLESSER